MNTIFKEIEKFKKWAQVYSDLPQDERGWEWECNYSDWSTIWRELEIFINESHFTKWTNEELNSILYIIARDNDSNYIIKLISKKPETFEFIAEKAINFSSADTKWQVVENLYKLENKAKSEQIIEKYLKQNIEYVSRMAIKILGKIKSNLTEKYCEKAWNWNANDPMSEYQRIMALTVLFEYESELTTKYINLAKQDGREYLVNLANMIEIELKRDKDI